jgi:hypothetical protein
MMIITHPTHPPAKHKHHAPHQLCPVFVVCSSKAERVAASGKLSIGCLHKLTSALLVDVTLEMLVDNTQSPLPDPSATHCNYYCTKQYVCMCMHSGTISTKVQATDNKWSVTVCENTQSAGELLAFSSDS